MGFNLSRIQFEDEKLNRFQDQCAALFGQLNKLPFFDGVLLQKVSLTTTPTALLHGLGKQPSGFIVVRNRGPAIIYDAQDTYAGDKTLYFNLIASAPTVADVWIF